MRKAKRDRLGLFVALGFTAAYFLGHMAIDTETTSGAVVGGALLLAAGSAAIIQGRRHRNRLDTPESLNVRDS
jgi:hypothetical protein